MNDNTKKRIGLQIGGTVGPNDEVGMHIPMPNKPGIGVQVDINDINNIVKKISEQIPDDHPKAGKIKKVANEILEQTDHQSKLQKVQQLIMTGAGITQIAESIAKLSEILGF